MWPQFNYIVNFQILHFEANLNRLKAVIHLLLNKAWLHVATVKMFTTKDCKKWNILFKTSNLAISCMVSDLSIEISFSIYNWKKKKNRKLWKTMWLWDIIQNNLKSWPSLLFLRALCTADFTCRKRESILLNHY